MFHHRFLRPVDAFVIVENVIVLLSDREADALLESEWTAAEQTVATRAKQWKPVASRLLHLTYVHYILQYKRKALFFPIKKLRKLSSYYSRILGF